MAWRFTGRAKVNPRNPRAFAVCQRCGFWINHIDGNWQQEWRGSRLMNIRVFVCNKCLDRPAAFLRPLILPPDPVPIPNAFPQNFEIADNGSPTTPPLPWPTQPLGPVVPSPPTPAPPVYVTPPDPPLPPEIGLGYPNQSEE